MARAVDGKRQLQLQSAVVEYVPLNNELDGAKRRSNDVQFGLASRLGLGLGFALSNNLQLHLLAGFSLRNLEFEVDDDYSDSRSIRTVQYEVTPSLRYVAASESATRVYLGLSMGVVGASQLQDTTDSRARGFHVGGTIGLYRFVARHLSIDPGLELSYVRYTTHFSADSGADQSVVGRGMRMLFTLGLSGWFGGREDETRVNESVQESALVGSASAFPAPVSVAGNPLMFRANLSKLILEVRGKAETSGNAVTLTMTHYTGAKSWARCPAQLVSDEGSHALQLRGLQKSGGLQRHMESISAHETVELLERWLSHSPGIVVCAERIEMTPGAVDELTAALEQFKRVALATGTRAPAPTVEP